MVEQMKRVTDIIGDGKIDFYPELERRDIEDVLGKDFNLMDAKILRDWPSEYGNGTSDWCLLMMQEIDSGNEFTTKCSGTVLVKRIAELQARKALPAVASIVMQGKAERPYYNVV